MTATHFLPPGIAGFEDAGGEEGPGFDFTSSPKANVALAKEYMRKAGYENGMYDGPPLLTIGDNESPAKETAEAFQEQVQGDRHQAAVPPGPARDDAVEVLPRAEVNMAICPNLGWGARLLRRAELHRSAVQRREHRAVGQRQHG